VVDGVQGGSIEMAHTVPYYFYGKNGVRAGLGDPVRPERRQMTAWMMHGNGRKLMNEFYAKYNIISFPAATPARRWAAGSARKSSRWPTSRA
jgi:TRAP-type mannitol/chloroaromatic compound transport system substrate-binding protein